MRISTGRLGTIAAAGLALAAAGLAGTASGAGPEGLSVASLPALTRYDGDAPLARRIAWRPGAGGIEWGTIQLRGDGEAWRTRLVVARIDPRRTPLELVPAFTTERRWTVAEAEA